MSADISSLTPQEHEALTLLINSFRTQMNDVEPELNILNGKRLQYTDSRVVRFLVEGLKDINRGSPKTTYTLYDCPDSDLLVRASAITALIAEGILQLRNQVDYSDSGFSVGLFNKTGGYQGWAGFLLQTYLQDKREFKNSIIPRSQNSGFVGVGSQFALMTRRRGSDV